jgi:hypothetical protein
MNIYLLEGLGEAALWVCAILYLNLTPTLSKPKDGLERGLIRKGCPLRVQRGLKSDWQ